MLPLDELIARCLDDDDSRWEELWPLVERAVLATFRRALRHQELDEGLAEDLCQELFLYFARLRFRALHNFHGATRSTLSGYLAKIAYRFGRKRAALWAHREARIAHAEEVWAQGPVDTRPSESRFTSALAELLDAIQPDQQAHLRSLLGPDADQALVTDRTLRRWVRDLESETVRRIL